MEAIELAEKLSVPKRHGRSESASSFIHYKAPVQEVELLIHLIPTNLPLSTGKYLHKFRNFSSLYLSC
ncbi:unnamed protein product [Rhizopus stolonifer]